MTTVTPLRALALLLALPLTAHAHPLAPALLDVEELAGGRAVVTWKQPALRVPGARAVPELPGCHPVSAAETIPDQASVVVRWTVDCGPAGLVGQRVGVAGLETAETDALLRLRLADGRLVQQVLRPRTPSVVVPSRPRRLDVVVDYARLGIEHILSGPDHLLFVLGLVLLVPTLRLLATTITAFTIGHSITLSLAVLDLARVPAGPIEVLIALSVLVLAIELARPAAKPTLMRRFPWVMALSFGLLHGLGFAGALRAAGLPAGEIPLALFSFNLGIEMGQLAFVLAALGLRAALRRLALPLPGWAAWAPVYVMGSLAAFWCFERAAAVLH